MTTMFRGRDGKPTPKAPGRYQVGSAPPVARPTTIADAVKAGWDGKRIRSSLVAGGQGGHLRGVK